MKKKILFVVLILLSVALTSAAVFGAYRCTSIIIEQKRAIQLRHMRAQRYEQLCRDTDSNTYIGFETSDSFDDRSFSFLTSEEVAEYRSQYADCSTYTMYNTLSDEDKLIYRAFEYAFDHYTNMIFFEEELINESTDFINIVTLFSLDSPMMEQNITYGYDRDPNEPISAVLQINDEEFGTVEREVSGYTINIKSFSSRHAEQHEQAYSNAAARVAAMPDGLSDMEKAKYLYKDLCKSTVYKDYETDGDHEQLYDALIRGETVCDGFANALSLMYNLAGIPCFEKIYTYKGSDPGHTWNCFFADGKWYNADATYESGFDENDPVDCLLAGFAFSDSFETSPHDYADIIPVVCSDDTLYKDRQYISKEDTDALISALAESCRRSGTTTGCVITDSLSDSEFDALDKALPYDGRISFLNTYYFFSVEYDGKDALFLLGADQ